MLLGESILDLKKKATEIGLTDIHKTAQHKVILNGKIVQDNFILADISMFVGSTRLSAIITSAGDEIRMAFNKDNLCDRLQNYHQGNEVNNRAISWASVAGIRGKIASCPPSMKSPKVRHACQGRVADISKLMLT